MQCLEVSITSRLMRLSLVAVTIGCLAAMVWQSFSPANAQGASAKPSVCSDARHPVDFSVAGRFWHPNLGKKEASVARFQIAGEDGSVVAFAEPKTEDTFEALVPWRHCHETLRLETMGGSRFSTAKKVSIKPSEEMVNFWGKHVVKLIVTIIDGSKEASLGTRIQMHDEAGARFEALLQRFKLKYGQCCATQESLQMFTSMVALLEDTDSLLDDAEHSASGIASTARAMADLITRAQGSSKVIPPYWVVRLEALATAEKIATLPARQKATLSRELAAASSHLVSGFSEKDGGSDSLRRLRDIASGLIRDITNLDLLRELSRSPKNLDLMWSLTQDNSVALVAIESSPMGALDLYTSFFSTAPLVQGQEGSQRKVAVQSSLYFGKYLDDFTQRLNTDKLVYQSRIRSDPIKLAYWSAFGDWLNRNEVYFAGGSTDQARQLKAYSALAKSILGQ